MQNSKMIGKNLLLLLYVALAIPSFAQTISNKSQLITIAPNTLFTIEGSLTNEGIITNHGTIALTGDWTNQGDYDHGTGTVILHGENDQTIEHKDQLFHTLEINGGGNKSLTSNATITSNLSLINGTLSPGKNRILLMQNNARIEGGSAVSYVNGAIYHTGNGYKFFPIGKDGHYRPVELLDVTGVSPVMGFEVISGNPYQRYGTIFKSVSRTRYWKRSQMSGSFNGSHIKIGVGEDDGIDDPEQLLIAEADMEEEIYRNIGNSSFTSNENGGELTSENLSRGEIFAIGTYSGFTDNRTLYVPNVLSHSSINPENQAVKVYGEEIDEDGFLFRVYNRWGMMIYENSSYERASTVGWTGVNLKTGEMESNGVYKYVLTGKFKSGVAFNEVGGITILQ